MNGARRARPAHNAIALRTLLSLLLLSLLASCARVQPTLQQAQSKAGIDQKPGVQVPRDVVLRDETGSEVRLGKYFNDQLVILVLAYFRCPGLCSEVLNGLFTSLKSVPLSVGKDFSVLVVSFDPTDTPSMAAAKKKAYLEQYDQASASSGWHFLTGEEDQVRRIADTVGFRYFFDSQTREYAHASGIMVLTPDGRVSRYFLGLDYPDRDLRLALVEASQGSIGTTTDRLLLFCLSYDPVTNRYRLTALSAVRIAGVVTVLAIGAGLVIAWRRERRRKRTTTSVMPAREGNDGA